eukprot:301602-Pyramimonas_sp.AAC.1
MATPAMPSSPVNHAITMVPFCDQSAHQSTTRQQCQFDSRERERDVTSVNAEVCDSQGGRGMHLYLDHGGRMCTRVHVWKHPNPRPVRSPPAMQLPVVLLVAVVAHDTCFHVRTTVHLRVSTDGMSSRHRMMHCKRLEHLISIRQGSVMLEPVKPGVIYVHRHLQ